MTALNSAASYVFDPNAKTIIFSNQGGTEVITLSQASWFFGFKWLLIDLCKQRSIDFNYKEMDL